MDEFDNFNGIAFSEEDANMKKKGRKRLFTALLITCIFLAAYIIYSLIMIFINLG